MKRTLGLAVATALLAAGLSACSTGSTTEAGEPAKGGSPSGADPDAFPVTIEHAFGKTPIESEPTRVATLGWTDQDHVLALGVVPVGATKLTWGGNDAGSSDWFDAELEELGGEAPVRYDDADGAPVAEVAKLAPDLILATNSGLTEKEYEKLSEIAPVVAYPEAPWVTPWRDSFEMVAKALGRTELAEEVLEETEAEIEAAQEEFPELQGTSFLFASLDPTDLSQISLYGPEDPRVRILEDFGMTSADVLGDIVPDGEFYGSISAEKAATLESDLLVSYAETPDDVKMLQKHPLVGRIPALKAGNVYAEVDKHVGLAVTNPTPLSVPFVVEHFLPSLADAAPQ